MVIGCAHTWNKTVMGKQSEERLRGMQRTLESSGARVALSEASSESLPVLPKEEAHVPFFRTFPRLCTQHFCLYHWLKRGHMTTSSCKKSGEMHSSCLCGRKINQQFILKMAISSPCFRGCWLFHKKIWHVSQVSPLLVRDGHMM